VPADSKVSRFIDTAKASGASDEALVGMLTAHGWSEKEAYRALAAHYQSLTNVEIPGRPGSGTAAKDAFFYLVLFSTLATWTIAFGSLAFDLIDKWLADPLSRSNFQYDMYSIAGSLASVIVAFPIFLLVSRAIVRDGRAHPEKLQSPVRKWLTYIALVIAAGCLIGDLITTLAYFLRGEITSRFLAKAFVVLVLSAGVFLHYYGGLKKSEESASPRGFIRDSWMAAFATLAVAGMIAWGFFFLGAPATQRTLRADESRVQDLYQIDNAIFRAWHSGSKMPQHLDELAGVRTADPVTRVSYEYHPKDGTRYELCATFSLPSKHQEGAGHNPWDHPAGSYCFSLDANATAESPPYQWRF
jgi:Domain of unknown function (DUF5671)